jgi:hypothetical protein
MTPFLAILSGLHQLLLPQINSKGAECKLERGMDTEDVLALVLSWLHLPCMLAQLMLIFSIRPACLSRYLLDGKGALLETFKQCTRAHWQVQWPNTDTMWHYARLITLGQSELDCVFSFIDGLNLAILDPPYGKEQNTMTCFNSWLGGCFCSCLLVFAPDSTIVYVSVKSPCSWHVSQLA